MTSVGALPFAFTPDAREACDPGPRNPGFRTRTALPAASLRGASATKQSRLKSRDAAVLDCFAFGSQ
jgi:hypothetical protein